MSMNQGDVKLAILGDHEAAKRLTETGYFKASGDLALCRCPFCGSEDVVYERYLHTAGYRWRVVCTSCMASIDPGYADGSADTRTIKRASWCCPVCDWFVGEQVEVFGRKHNQQKKNFCDRCGQMIAWESVEKEEP